MSEWDGTGAWLSRAESSALGLKPDKWEFHLNNRTIEPQPTEPGPPGSASKDLTEFRDFFSTRVGETSMRLKINTRIARPTCWLSLFGCSLIVRYSNRFCGTLSLDVATRAAGSPQNSSQRKKNPLVKTWPVLQATAVEPLSTH